MGDSPLKHSRVRSIGESPHTWPKSLPFSATNMLLYSILTCIPVAESLKNRWKLPCLQWIGRFWYCDVMQTIIVKTFCRLLSERFLSGSRTSSRRRRFDYHSSMIEWESRCSHWLSCKKLQLQCIRSFSWLMWSHCKYVVRTEKIIQRKDKFKFNRQSKLITDYI